MQEITFIKEIAIDKYRGSIFLLIINEFLGALLLIVGIGTFIPFLSSLLSGSPQVDGPMKKVIVFLGLENETSLNLLFFLSVIILARFVLDAARSLIAGRLVEDIIYKLRIQLTEKMSELPWIDILSKDHGHYIQCINTEASLAGGAVNDLSAVIANSIMMASIFLALCYVSPSTVVISIAAGTILFLLQKKPIKNSHIASRNRIQAISRVNNLVTDMRNMMKLIKAEGLENIAVGSVKEKIKEAKNFERKQLLYSILVDLYNNIYIIGIIALLAYIHLGIETGNGADFIFNLILLQRISTYFANFQQKRRNMAQKIPSYLACRDLIAAPLLPVNTAPPHSAISKETSPATKLEDSYIKLEKLSYTYPNGTESIKDISAEFPTRGVVAIVGESGSGKTTLLDCITGLLEPNSGRILINGKEKQDYDAKDWHNLFTYVPQTPYLFQGTLHENLCLGTENITQQQITKALTDSYSIDIVKSLNKGIDTEISSGGLTLSGGERQRLCIARGMLRQTPVFILDEPTAALDNFSEDKLRNVIHKIAQSRLVIIVTHSDSFIMEETVVIRLEKGRLQEAPIQTSASLSQ